MTASQTNPTALRERLGDILLRKGRLNHEELSIALSEARRHGVRLGAHLVASGALFEDDIALALADQFGLRYVVVDNDELDLTLASLLPEATARKLTALPLSSTDGRVRVAIADPSDVVGADEIRLAIPGAVDFVVSEPSAINSGIDKLYEAWSTLDDSETITVVEERRHAAIDADDAADSPPAIEEVNRLLRRSIQLGASDIHFVPRRFDLQVRARVDGVMRDLAVVPPTLMASVIARLKVMGQLDIAERRLPQDGRVSISIAGADMDMRVAVLPSAHGEEVVLRVAYIGQQGLRTIDDLGLDAKTLAILRSSISKPGGAIIVAGPTGSGKTTTLYSAIGELNDGSRTIVSIEDPVESHIDGVVQIEVKPRAGLTFARGLRTILRADPDVILIGEIRDRETAEIVLEAAMTGHVVLTTVHAQSAASGLVRLRDLGVPETSLGSAVRCVLSQRLLRKPCPRCREGVALGADELARVGLTTSKTLYRPTGCSSCDSTGYVGRIGIYEALAVDEEVRGALHGTAAGIEAAASSNSSELLYQQALRLCETGETTVDEVLRVLGDWN